MNKNLLVKELLNKKHYNAEDGDKKVSDYFKEIEEECNQLSYILYKHDGVAYVVGNDRAWLEDIIANSELSKAYKTPEEAHYTYKHVFYQGSEPRPYTVYPAVKLCKELLLSGLFNTQKEIRDDYICSITNLDNVLDYLNDDYLTVCAYIAVKKQMPLHHFIEIFNSNFTPLKYSNKYKFSFVSTLPKS